MEKIIKEDGLNTLIVNLYPGSEGYSLMLRDIIGKETETVRLPYEVCINMLQCIKVALKIDLGLGFFID